MSTCGGGDTSGLALVPKDQPLCVPWGSHHEGGDFRLSLVCCLDAFKRCQLEDTDRATSLPSGISSAGAAAAPDLGEINSQTGVTGESTWSPSPELSDTSLG